jgi:hypothetical protein
MYRAYYKPMTTQTRKPRQQPADLVMSADRIWAAAAYADRENGGEYLKEDRWMMNATPPYLEKQANKTLMWKAIMDVSFITGADIDVGRQARDWVRKNLVFKGLKNTMTDFEQALSRVVEMEEFMTGADRYEIALVTSQIRAYREGTRMEQVMADVITTPVADVGEKVQLNVEVVKSVYSQNFNVYFITAKTDGHQMVFFSYRERKAPGEFLTIRGHVKAHRSDATQLNRVRIAK